MQNPAHFWVEINSIVSANMARAMRKATVERGLDIRAFDMIAFGGAGPMHAAEVARLCGVRRVVIPAFSSGFSALGCVAATMSYARQLTVNMTSIAWDQARLDALLARQTSDLSAALVDAGHEADSLLVSHIAGIRYSGQSYETQIADAMLNDPEQLGVQFDAAHRALFGYATGEAWELVSVRTEVRAPERQAPQGFEGPQGLQATDAPGAASASGEPAIGARQVTFENGDSAMTPVFDRLRLRVDQTMPGPLIIEDEWSTIIVPPGDSAFLDSRGNIHLNVSAIR